MEIEVGDYVRYYGTIIKIKQIEKPLMWGEDGSTILTLGSNKLKHSKNIIDLIEVGDYVNGLRVEYITNEAIFTSGLAHGILFEDIRTIVTKEQMASIEYKVEGGKWYD